MNIKKDFCLLPFNTFGLKVKANELAIITSVDELHALYKDGKLKNNNLLILSKGSNVLFTQNIEGLVLLNQIWGKEVVYEDEDTVLLKVNSGEFWPALVDYTVNMGWGGLENMTDIPGKIGAAPIQNIGAYGSELKDVMVSLEAFNLNSGIINEFKSAECKFGYRTSIFKTKHKGKFFITSVLLMLSKKPKLNLSYKPLSDAFTGIDTDSISIQDVSRKISEIRNSKIPDPEELKSAGSFFKNPVINKNKLNELTSLYPNIPSFTLSENKYKIPAAWLIEKCGWKGKRKGDVGTYRNQALIIINFGNASGKEIFEFAQSIKKSVITKFGINLEFEVNVV